jgi:hypothetical protein
MSSLEATTHTLPDEEKASTSKAKAAVGAADRAKEKIKAKDVHSPTTNTSSSQLNAHGFMSAKRKPSKSPNYLTTATTPWNPTLAPKLLTNHDNRPQVVRSCACTAQIQLMSPKPVTPAQIQRSTTIAHTTASTIYYYWVQCRVMSNDDSYTTQQQQATLPSDCSPRGNDVVEPHRQSTFLKSWGRYSKRRPASPPRVPIQTHQSFQIEKAHNTAHQPPAPPTRVPLIQFPAHNTTHRIFTSTLSKSPLSRTAAPLIYLFENATPTYSRTTLLTPTTLHHQDSTSLTITRSSPSHIASSLFRTRTLL